VNLAIAAPIASGAAQQNAAAVDLSGKWTLDTYLTDSSEQVLAAIRVNLGQGQGEQIFGGGFEGGRYGRGGGMGRRGNPNGPPGRAGSPQLTPDEQKRLDDLIAPIRYPPPTLTISQTASSVTFTDGQGQTRTVAPTGKHEKQTLGDYTFDMTSRWEGPQLVSEQDLDKGRKATYTYSIVPTTKQLLVRITFERSPGQTGPIEIRQVYNRGGP
jgi:hypothetical protein